jgi:integrase
LDQQGFLSAPIWLSPFLELACHTLVTTGEAMASIRKRGKRWQVQVRRHGQHPLSKSFLDKADALRWAREQEVAVDRGDWITAVQDNRKTLRDLLSQYEREMSPRKRSPSDQFHLRQIARHPIGSCCVRNLTAEAVAEFRDDRLKQVSGSTVRKEMNLLGSVLKVARAEWSLVLRIDPMAQVKKPPAGQGRTRRLDLSEGKRLDDALRRCRNPIVRHVFLFALATGMRRGEVLSLTWRNINWCDRTALLPLTKNGESRLVPLSPSAVQVLHDRRWAFQLNPQDGGEAVVFPISANAFRLAWERVKRRAGVGDLRFHDLRHEAISRFFEIGLSVPEVALISGHRDPRMLLRYTHLKPETIARKLQSAQPAALAVIA